jgi:hypothetical protein
MTASITNENVTVFASYARRLKAVKRGEYICMSNGPLQGNSATHTYLLQLAGNS